MFISNYAYIIYFVVRLGTVNAGIKIATLMNILIYEILTIFKPKVSQKIASRASPAAMILPF